MKGKIITWSVTIAAIAIASVALFLIAAPPTPSYSEREKIGQLIPPMDLEDVEAQVAIQRIADAARIPVRVFLCRPLAQQRITIRLEREMPLGDAFYLVAAELQCDLRLYGGIEGHFARPTFDCSPVSGDYVVIDRLNPRNL